MIPHDAGTEFLDLLSPQYISDLIAWGASLQYSIPYLQANVKDLGLPEWLGNLTPIYEENGGNFRTLADLHEMVGQRTVADLQDEVNL